MSFVGGDIKEITWNHPSLGNGVLSPKSKEAGNFNTGGYTSADDDNGVTGAGEVIDIMNNERWSWDGTCAWDMNVRDELSKLKELAGDPVPADWTISHKNGTVWGGKGKPVGSIKADSNAATIQVKLAGGDRMKKIVG